MNVQTKYNVGDSVCTIDKKALKIREFEIEKVIVNSSKSGAEVKYHAKGDSVYADDVPEEHCFPSRDELLSHISGK